MHLSKYKKKMRFYNRMLCSMYVMIFVLVVNLIWLNVGDIIVHAEGNYVGVIPEPIPVEYEVSQVTLIEPKPEETSGCTVSSLGLYAGITAELMKINSEELIELSNIVNTEVDMVTTYEVEVVESEVVPVVEAEVVETPEYRMEINNETLEVLTRVVEAEVTGSSYTYKGEKLTYDELLQSKIRVAQVFMNRVEDNDSFKFIDDLYESLTYKGASSTFGDGRYYKVEITDITREAVKLALLAETQDYTDGALYFSSGTTECAYGNYMFTDDVGHSFFK